MTTLREYRRLRSVGFNPKIALSYARTRKAFEALEDCGLVRLDTPADEIASFDDLAGDCFAPEHCLPMSGGVRALTSQEKAFKAEIERDGIYGIVGQYRESTNGEWINADSVWGFIGEQWRDSGYDYDIMGATLDALKNALRKRVRHAIHADGTRS